MNRISPDEIKRISLDIVNVYFNGVRKNQCDSIANEIAYTIESEFDILLSLEAGGIPNVGNFRFTKFHRAFNQ